MLVGQVQVKIFSLMAGGGKEKAVEVMDTWKTQPNSVPSLSLALDCSFLEQLEKERQHLTNMTLLKLVENQI